MSKSNGEEEAEELEQRSEFSGDSEYEASSSSAVTTGSSAQFSEELKKRPRYSCTFHPESNKFTRATVSRKGPTYARCTVCNRDVSVAYGGTKDLRKHEQTRIHQAVKNSQSGATSLSLSTETLSALLCLQFNVSKPCFDFKPTKEMIEKCRNAISSVSTQVIDFYITLFCVMHYYY